MSTEYTSTELRKREEIIVSMASIMALLGTALVVPYTKEEKLAIVGEAMHLCHLAANTCPAIRDRLVGTFDAL